MNVQIKEYDKTITLTLDTNNTIGKGGEGEVYKIISPLKYAKTHCVKIYHNKQKAKQLENKIHYLCNNKPKYSQPFIKLCWPEKQIYINNKFRGYLMPLAFNNSHSLFEIKPINYISISNLANEIKNRFDRSTTVGIINRMKLIVHIAIAYYEIHSTNKYLIADLKPDNILFDKNLNVSIIDCDSFQIIENNIVLYSATAITPEYTPPEYYNMRNLSNINKDWDYFSFAILSYEIMYGVHPFSATFKNPYNNFNDIANKIENRLFVHGSKKKYLKKLTNKNPHTNFKYLPLNIQKLWINSLDNTTNRTSFEDFGKTFTIYINQNSKKDTLIKIIKLILIHFLKINQTLYIYTKNILSLNFIFKQ